MHLLVDSRNVYFNPTIGLAVKDNWVVGLSAGVSTYKNSPNNSSNKQTIKGYSGGLFVRRYSSLGKGFYLYGNGAISYSKNSQTVVNGIDYETRNSSKGISLHISPGIAYAVSKRIHLETSINDLFYASYAKTKTENIFLNGHNTTEGKDFSLGTNLNTTAFLSVGFRFVLGK